MRRMKNLPDFWAERRGGEKEIALPKPIEL